MATTGDVVLRQENISAIVTGFALQAYKLKTICMVESSSSWQESYFKESKAELTGGTGSAVKGIPRLAQFPYGEVTWTKVSSYIEKYGLEGVISYEDQKMGNIGQIARTLLRIGRAVAYAVDNQIARGLFETSGINTSTISATYEWDSLTVANRDPVQDILNGKKELATDNYDPDDGNGYLLVNPTDYANLLGNSKIINNPTFKSADIVTNGVVGQLLGLKIIVTNSLSTTSSSGVALSGAIVLKAKEAMTWKEATPLTTLSIEDPGIKTTIRAFELGVLQVPNPEAICWIKNTKR